MASLPAIVAKQTLPNVDLGYEMHQAISYDSAGQTYNFSKIRYAQPPVGNLRFAAPASPVGRNTHIQDGSVGHVCPQAPVGWGAIAFSFVGAHLTGQPFDFDAVSAALQSGNARSQEMDERITEDCLFLDVIVPKTVFDTAQTSEIERSRGNGAPVLVWINHSWFIAGAVPTSYSSNLADIFRNLAITTQKRLSKNSFSMLNARTLQEARGLPSNTLIGVNAQQMLSAPYGIMPYGPVVDGLFAPDLPGKLLSHRSFARNIKIMIGYCADEGLLFVDPRVSNDADLKNYLRTSMPVVKDSVSDYIVNDLYPPIYDGSQLYTSLTKRIALLLSEAFFTCNSNYLDHAYSKDVSAASVFIPPALHGQVMPDKFDNGPLPGVAETVFASNRSNFDHAHGNNIFAYQFSIPPAVHGQDLPYTFYNGPSPEVTSEAVAQALQGLHCQFRTAGYPHQ